MKFISTRIPDLIMIEPTVFEDDRGWFFESFNEKHFHKNLKDHGLSIPRSFVQDNQSFSKKNVLRGLHYQLAPYMQGKLVSVVQGAVFDVAVDIRENSPTFGQWVGVELSAHNRLSLWIPEGFAHGFLTLEDNTHFVYKTTDHYSKIHEATIAWDDPELNIKWPLKAWPFLADKDQHGTSLKEALLLPLQSNQAVIRKIDLPVIGDTRGSLIALERKGCIPFSVQRVYYIFKTKQGVSRGFHAHKSLQQLLVCVSGSCCLILDDGKTRESVFLNSPQKAILIGGMVWREMHDFSEDCVLMVLASQSYDEEDYIRSYDEFMNATMSLS